MLFVSAIFVATGVHAGVVRFVAASRMHVCPTAPVPPSSSPPDPMVQDWIMVGVGGITTGGAVFTVKLPLTKLPPVPEEKE